MSTYQITHNDGKGGEDTTEEVEADRAEYDRERNQVILWDDPEGGDSQLVGLFNFVGALKRL